MVVLTLQSPVSSWLAHPTIGPAIVAEMNVGLTDAQAERAWSDVRARHAFESLTMQEFLHYPGAGIRKDAAA